jgi:flavin reductase (DIM6/NTAB) family NADH-FMN oxidoreductase RutF
MTVDQRSFRAALGAFATGVAVATAPGRGGPPAGVTVNSFTSVSLDPPLVLFCLDRSAQSLEAFREADHFAVSVLAEGQRDLSVRFASQAPGKFEGVGVAEGLGGAPVLEGCLAAVECSRHAVHDGGDHVILVGRVERLRHADGGRPLLYFRGRYASLGHEG